MQTTSSDLPNGRQRPAEGLKPRLRRRLALLIACSLALVFALSATYVIANVLRARSDEIERLRAASSLLSQALDREVARSHALLIGLEHSPALQAHDIRAFQQQMASTKVPDGAWLTLSDREKLVAHSLRPFGSPLPTLADFKPQPAFFERIDQLDVSLTGRVLGVTLDKTAVAVNMKVRDADGRWTYFLTTVLSDHRFASILKDQRMPAKVTAGIYDHNLHGVVAMRGEKVFIAPVMAPAALSALGAESAAAGLISAADAEGHRSLLAYARSDATHWVSMAATRLDDLDAPVHRALKILALAGVLMGLAGFAAWRYLRREIEPPIDQLEKSIATADAAVKHLTGRLLQAQEDEHQRIARELHDSTAQHLVGAMLGVVHLERTLPGDDAARGVLKDVKTTVESALNELRTFTLLLHPRDLGESGLAHALTDFVQGFLRRAGLRGTVSVDEAADSLPFELQRSLLRIAQAALANVYRHAKATQVQVRLEIDAQHVVLSIDDDGLGGRHQSGSDQGHGVGIPSMQGRLIPFGGELKFEITASGTSVRAIVPRPVAG